jgi:hypothetical protein
MAFLIMRGVKKASPGVCAPPSGAIKEIWWRKRDRLRHKRGRPPKFWQPHSRKNANKNLPGEVYAFHRGDLSPSCGCGKMKVDSTVITKVNESRLMLLLSPKKGRRVGIGAYLRDAFTS